MKNKPKNYISFRKWVYIAETASVQGVFIIQRQTGIQTLKAFRDQHKASLTFRQLLRYDVT